MPKKKINKKPKKPKRKLSNAEKKARRERKRRNRELFEYIFINGKQKRVRKDPTEDYYTDPIFLHQNGMWDVLDQQSIEKPDYSDPAYVEEILNNPEEPCIYDRAWWCIASLPDEDRPITTTEDPRFEKLTNEQQEAWLKQARREAKADKYFAERCGNWDPDELDDLDLGDDTPF